MGEKVNKDLPVHVHTPHTCIIHFRNGGIMYNEEKGGKQNKEIAEGKDFMYILQAIILQSQKKYNNNKTRKNSMYFKYFKNLNINIIQYSFPDSDIRHVSWPINNLIQ